MRCCKDEPADWRRQPQQRLDYYYFICSKEDCIILHPHFALMLPQYAYQAAATLLIGAKVEVKDKQLPNLTLQESITFNVLDIYLVILL